MMFWSVGPFWYMVYGIWYVVYGMKMAFTVYSHMFCVCHAQAVYNIVHLFLVINFKIMIVHVSVCQFSVCLFDNEGSVYSQCATFFLLKETSLGFMPLHANEVIFEINFGQLRDTQLCLATSSFFTSPHISSRFFFTQP